MDTEEQRSSPLVIGDDDLRPSHVPDPEADWEAIFRFALTFDGYSTHGSFEACARVANSRSADSLEDLRTCLFFEQRRWRHFGCLPSGEEAESIRGLVRQIRDRVAGRQGRPNRQ